MSDPSGRLAVVLDALPVGILAVNGKGRVEFENSEASRILGISAATLRKRPLRDLLGAGHPAVTLLGAVVETQREVSSTACSLPRGAGEEPLMVDLAASPIRSSRGEPGAVLTLRDRTIGRELEALVDQRTRAELYAQLAAGIAHEVRNPLGGIRGAAELLESKLENPTLQRYSSLIREETDRIRRLLDDLAELTRGEDLRPRPVNLNEVLDRLLTLQARSEAWQEIEIRREYDPSIPEIELDPDRITQVFLNLFRNAVQAMDGRGRLLVRTRVETIYQVAPSRDVQERSRMVSIDVEDEGPGIPEEDLPHVFTPFFTRREQGTGLGLPIAQQWVVRHGGRIRVSPGPSGGTQVRVLLPIRRHA